MSSANFSPAPVPPEAGQPARVSSLERGILTAILIAFVVVGFNNVRNGAYVGQDWNFHYDCVRKIAADCSRWFFMDVTSRPLIYWIAWGAETFTRGAYGFQLTALGFVLAGAGGLALAHDALRWSIAYPALRLATVALFAFLPVHLIATVVFAADALTLPLFALTAWSLLRCLHAPDDRSRLRFTLVGAAALGLAQFQKFTFLLLPAGILAFLLLDGWLNRKWAWRRHAGLVAGFVVFPVLVGLWLHQKASRELAHEPPRHSFNWKGTGEMTWRSVLLPRSEDAFLLDAPTYWTPPDQPEARTLRLLQSNRYSYPGLLHLGVFTDVLNYAHGGQAPRPPSHQVGARWSVRWGLWFSAAVLVAVAAFAWRTARGLTSRQYHTPSASLLWAILGACWFFPLLIQLPYVHHAYEWGYWLPRLVLPALWTAIVLLATEADALARRLPWLPWLFTLFVALQTGFGLWSVWR